MSYLRDIALIVATLDLENSCDFLLVLTTMNDALVVPRYQDTQNRIIEFPSNGICACISDLKLYYQPPSPARSHLPFSLVPGIIEHEATIIQPSAS